DLLRRNAVGAVGPCPHEFDAAARDDEGLELVGTQEGQQFQHRLEDEVGIGPLETRMTSCGQPIAQHLPELLGGEAAVRGRYDLEHALSPMAASASRFSSSAHLKGSRVFQSGWRAVSAFAWSRAK